MPDPNVFHVERNDTTLLLVPRRNISSVAAENIQAELQTIVEILAGNDIRDVVVDLESVPHFGSEMLGALHVIWRRVRAGEGRMLLCNVSPVGREILQVAKFDALWPIHASRSEALAALS